MTSNAPPPPPGGPAGRRRALGRGPGAVQAEPAGPAAAPAEQPAAGPDPEAPAAAAPDPAGPGGTHVALTGPDRTSDGAAGAGEPSTAVPPREPAGPGAVAVRDRQERSAGPTAPEPGGAAVSPPVSLPASPSAPLPASRAAEDASARGAGRPGPGHPEAAGEDADGTVFKVRLANFEGPFDLLLQLISRHKLDVTEVALSKVTDEFMAYIRALGPDWDLDETTEFLVVAATLLDLKAARLLPAAEVEDEADLALLEARDLLFARLLQYRAYKQVADIFNDRLDDEARRYPRTVGLEPEHAELLPEVVISIGAAGFARLAVKAMQPKPKPQVYVDHIHAPLVSVQEQAGIVVARLRELGEASFRTLVADTDDTLTVVARFLALLELYREKAVALEQETALGDLLVRWTGGDGDEAPTVTDEFDRPPEPPKEERTP
ncbi:segregation/condensation protein A [Streptomyces sp. NPDC086081]|uniref:segregation and condensation protein A n=1 Tax=Streptomyces sp. NPDC086081 TaxID=3365749 RepID=UPI00382333B4